MDTTALSLAVQEMSHTASPCASVERSFESGRREVVSVQEHHTFCTIKRMQIGKTLHRGLASNFTMALEYRPLFIRCFRNEAVLIDSYEIHFPGYNRAVFQIVSI